MSISVDDCINLDGMERSILAKVKDLSVISELLKHVFLRDSMMLVLEMLVDVESGCVLPFGIMGSQRFIRSWMVLGTRVYGYGNVDPMSTWEATEFAYWAPNIESMEVNSESNPLERKGCRGNARFGDDYGSSINDGCIKDCMEKNLEDDAGEEFLESIQGDCGNVTTDDN
ncbi:hypothetical protein Tco_1228401 [Tanacetum coccineum]